MKCPPEKLAFAIHDLNRFGGQERSTVEIIERIAQWVRIDCYAFSYSDFKFTQGIRFFKIWPCLNRPVLIKMILFHLNCLVAFTVLRFTDREKTKICATGACSLLSDVIHVQFVHAHWQRIEPSLGIYGKIVALYNLATERIAFGKKKKYIAISNSVKKSLIDCYQLPDVTVVHHGVDTSLFKPCQDSREKMEVRRALQLEAEVFTILYVGTYERKGLAVAMHALEKLKSSVRKRFKLIAVGAGSQEKFAALAKELGISDHLVLLSPKKNIQDYFRASDLFLFPTKYEPFGLVILEAMACGLVPIVSALAGASELIEHEKSGYVIQDPSCSDEIHGYLHACVENSDKLMAMGGQCRKIAETRTWDVVAQEYIKAISC